MIGATHITLLCIALGGGGLHALQHELSGKPQSEAVVLKRARHFQAERKFQLASELLSEYLATHTADVPSLTLLAEVRHDSGDDANALRSLSEALNVDPHAREANLLAGKLLLSESHYPEAMDRFETLLESSPRDKTVRGLELEAVTKLAANAAQTGKPEAALEALKHARTKMPDNSHLLMEVGLQALDLKLFAESTEALHSARALSPSDPDISYALARLELEEQHMPEAEADLNIYLAARPDDASAHFGLGRIFAMQQRDDEARREFERSAKLQPNQTESYYQLGQLDLNARRNDEARPLFERVIARDPKHGGALVGLGQMAFQARDYDMAQSYLKRAVETAPDYGPGHYYLGLTLARLGKKDEADKELQIATQLGKVAAAPIRSAQPPASSR